MLFEDLFDIEKRPGAGVGLWTRAVEMQLERVRDANYRHRLHHSPNEDEQRDDAEAESQLHADVYFPALAVRRVELFHDVLARHVHDDRLTAARTNFASRAPNVRALRDLYEHIDSYLLDDPKKHRPVPGRAAPKLRLRWDADNVVVEFGSLRVDVTLAAVAAIELGRASEAIWDEYLERTKAERRVDDSDSAGPEPGSRLELTLGISTVIGGADESQEIYTGVLFDAGVRPPASDAPA